MNVSGGYFMLSYAASSLCEECFAFYFILHYAKFFDTCLRGGRTMDHVGSLKSAFWLVVGSFWLVVGSLFIIF